MPAVSSKQRKFMGAELARKRAGKKTQTKMSEAELEKFAAKTKRRKMRYGNPNTVSARPLCV